MTDKARTPAESAQDKARRGMLVNEYANVLTAYALAMEKLRVAAMAAGGKEANP